MNLFICLTLAEWKNLCSKGRIRAQNSRIFKIESSVDEFILNDFFNSIPDRHAIGSSVDYIVAEISKDEIEKDILIDKNITTQIIELKEILSFFPLQDEDEWNFSGDAEKVSIKISKSRFEKQWNEWSRLQLKKEAVSNGLLLQNLLNFESNENQILDSLSVDQIYGLLEDKFNKTTHSITLTEKIINSYEEFFNISQEDFDKNSFWISNVVAYIDTNLGKNFFENNHESKKIALKLYELNSKLDFSLRIREDKILISYLEELNKDSLLFNEYWSPITIVLFTRLIRRIKFAKPKPEEIIESLLFIKEMVGNKSAQLLTFIIGVLLGSNKVHSIERIIRAEKFPIALNIDKVV